VSRVINGVRNVDPAITEAVNAAIAETGYVPNRAARSLVTGRTFSVALVVSAPDDEPDFDDPFIGRAFADPFFGRIANGALDELTERGVHLILQRVNSAAARAQLIGHLRQGDIDGVLLISVHALDPLPRMLVDQHAAVVLFGRPVDPIAISYVDVAERDGAALAAEHLVSLGCRRVAMICGPLDTPAGGDRLAGFRDAMARHGHPYVPVIEGNFTLDGGESGMLMLLDDEPALDGLFAANDLMAQGALVALREAGKRVPEDVAVVGFDDSSAALAARPQLTTVLQPVEEMAKEMARLLLARIEDDSLPITSVIFDPTLVIRDSA